ncbi:MAG: hypothetical protein JF616_21645 [Fibrobacteres bacterium]|nr:hypothetical protein [Fibrobacterota bacterium]
MSYFSPKSTWLSLVDAGKPARESAPLRIDPPRSHGPDGFALPDPDFVAVPPLPAEGGDSASSGSSPVAEEGMMGAAESAEDLDHLRITIDLRHKLFFHFREWEFGPALLEDHVRMARAQTDPEEALAEYCLARHVAVTLVGKLGQEEHRLGWIEVDRVIAEIEVLIGNLDSAAVYAREGLKAIKNGRFGAEHDMRITRLAVRFLNLLEGR